MPRKVAPKNEGKTQDKKKREHEKHRKVMGGEMSAGGKDKVRGVH